MVTSIVMLVYQRVSSWESSVPKMPAAAWDNFLSNVSVMSKGVGGDVLGVFMAQ